MKGEITLWAKKDTKYIAKFVGVNIVVTKYIYQEGLWEPIDIKEIDKQTIKKICEVVLSNEEFKKEIMGGD